MTDVFKPSDIAEDPSRLVAGISGLQSTPKPAVPAGVEPAKVVDLTTDKVDKTPDKAETDPIKTCPACGILLSDDGELKPTDIEKDRWLRHILGEPRFIQTFKMFGGRVAVTFRSRTTAENDMIFNQLTDEVKSGDISEYAGIMSPAYYTRMGRFILAFSLVSVETLEKDVPQIVSYPEVSEKAYPETSKDDQRPLVVRVHDAITTSRSEGQLGAILVAHRRFESLVATLMRHSDDPDFWNPTVAGT